MIKTAEVSGMHCSSCAKGIESLLKSQEGIEMAKVDYDSNQLKVEYTEEADLEEAWKRIREMGYEVDADGG